MLAVLLGVRCDLPLDFAAVTDFAEAVRVAELLLFLDGAAELGAKYPMDQVVAIVRERMPDHQLKSHLLFHLTQSIPTDAGPTSGEVSPALIVFRAVRDADRADLALLDEAVRRGAPL